MKTREEAFDTLGRELLDALREGRSKPHVQSAYNLAELTHDFEALIRHAYDGGDLFLHITADNDVAPIPDWVEEYMLNAVATVGSDYGEMYSSLQRMRETVVIETILSVYSFLSLP